MNQQPSEKSIFLDAIEQPSTNDRAAYLDAVCGDDPKLREEIEVLLRAHDRTDDLLDLPDSLRPAQGVTEGPGTTVGRYKLLEQIGEGGFGVVWTAEQREPIKRRVALKIIKIGMDTKQVVGRFEEIGRASCRERV
jgi:serine/threonine protein kinase